MAEVEDAAPCPSCGTMAAPEQDDNLLYWSCVPCGYDFGYRTVQQEQTCAAGIPLHQITGLPPSVQRREDTLTRPVFLGSTIARRPQ